VVVDFWYREAARVGALPFLPTAKAEGFLGEVW
jgi:hypothetical protein